MREIADARVHATTGGPPADRFERAERDVLRGLGGRASFQAMHEVTRRVRRDGSIELATNAYSVPWWLIGARVRVRAQAGTVTIPHGIREVARHRLCCGGRERVVDPAHFRRPDGRSRPPTSFSWSHGATDGEA